MELPVTGPAYDTEVPGQDQQKLINWYLVPDQSGGKYPFFLRPTPGMTSFSTPSGANVRALLEHKDILYAVVDETFYSIASDGTATSRGTLDTSNGLFSRPILAAGDSEIMVVDEQQGWIYNTSDNSFTQINDPDFPSNPIYVTFQDSYFIVAEEDSQAFYISGSGNGLAWNALDFAQANSKPDDLEAVYSYHQELWLFGSKYTEVWYNSGNADFPFLRRPGILVDKGIAARDTLVEADGTLYWLAKDKNGDYSIARNNGFAAQIISTPAITKKLNDYTTVSDAFAYTHRVGMNEFYVITFPTEDQTWAYDILTGQWHERQSYVSAQYHAHRGSCHAYAYGKSIVGDNLSNALFEYSTTTYTENSNKIRRLRQTSPLSGESNRLVSIYNLQVDMKQGVGLDSGQGSDPQIMLRVSKDGGNTYGNYLYRDIGVKGEYNARTKWDALGQGRNWVLEFSITDPVEAVVLGATADIEMENT